MKVEAPVTDPDTSGTPASMTRSQRRTVAGVIALSLVVVGAVTSGTAIAVYHHLNTNITVGAEIPPPTGPAASQIPEHSEALNVLILGTDTRAGGDAVDGEEGCNCSDTTILLHASADRKTVYGVSIPRDALVDPVSCTEDHPYLTPDGVTTPYVEWNAAYSIGGAACTAEQVQQNFGVRVDDYVVIDFEGFQNMVDDLGGIDICVPFELYDPRYAELDLEPGPSVHIDGLDSLKYVRLRHGYYPITGTYTPETYLTPRLDGTDPGRIKRQQYFLSVLVDKILSSSTLTSPTKLYNLADDVTKSITTDPALGSVGALVGLAGEFKHLDLDHIKFVTLPSRNYGAGPYVNRVEVLPAAQQLMSRVSNDQDLGGFASGATSAGTHRKKTPEEVRAANLAAGLCA